MTIAVLANDQQYSELTQTRQHINWRRVNSNDIYTLNNNDDAIFCLIPFIDKTNFTNFAIPIFINAVTATLAELKTGANVIRINGWPTFLSRTTWEIAGIMTDNVKEVLNKLQIKACVVADEPGFVSAKVISMIVNEAYFALEENVSSKQEIDVAMKLGTNYPFGPFEWCKKIGEQNIVQLLKKLSASDTSYEPATLLVAESKLEST